MLQIENGNNWPYSFQDVVNLMMGDGRRPRSFTCHLGDLKTT